MRRRLLFFMPVIGLVLCSTTAAGAATSGPGQPAGHSCVARALPAASTQRPLATCYATFAQAIRAATNGRIRLPDSATSSSITLGEIDAVPAAPDTEFVLSIDWVNSNFSGLSLIWQQSAKCGSFGAASMPSGWNDVVSSVETESGCANTLYQNNNFGTPTFAIGVNKSVSGLGSFNDKTSSEKWS